MCDYTRKIEFVEYDDKKIYGIAYIPKIEGTFPSVIFSHGYNGTHESFDSYGKYLASNGIGAYAYDFCGGSVNSKSSMKTTEMTIASEQDDLRAVIKSVQNWANVDKDNIFLFGESQGGLVTALTAEDYSDTTRGMILLYPAFCVPDDWTSKYGDINAVPEEISFWGMTLGINFVKSVYGFNVKEHIGKYNNNVLILHGDKDPVVSPNYSFEMAKEYENSKVVIFPGEGHGFTEEGSDKVRHMLLKFVKENIVVNK